MVDIYRSTCLTSSMAPITDSTFPRTAIDLFCGCGGISEGLRMAGFEVLAGIDVEPKYISTFKHNFPDAVAVTKNLDEIDPLEFLAAINLDASNIGILAGGPPCQGFSKNVPRKNRQLADPRNKLVQAFLRFAKAIRPRFVLMENVAEMKNGFDGHYSDEVISTLSESGYSVSHMVVNAADFGVPQRRKRAFFIASLTESPFHPPAPTHLAPAMSGKFSSAQSVDLFTTSRPPHVSVWDAIGDLPALAHGEGADTTSYSSPPTSPYQAQLRNRDGQVKNHIARKLQPMQFARLNALKPGQGLRDLPIHLQTKGGYSGAYGRLTKDMVAPTITRWVFHPGSGRWGHPNDIRVLTIREVARIQGFPDSFEFIGSYNDQAGQLGNAVPPILIKALIDALLVQTQSSKDDKSVAKPAKDNISLGLGKSKRIA
jgi:DNA (cytosine-5)-methyltransferase 1